MNDSQLLRYSRHLLLPQVDVVGQQKLLDAKVLIVGLGGLGSPVALYLAAAGVGQLWLADGDRVDLTNLQRQILHDTIQVGQFKTASAQAKLHALNPDVQLILLTETLEITKLMHYVVQVDAVVDCSDNFASRFALNQACVHAKKPLISGAALRFQGQVTVFLPRGDSPCYRCLYPDHAESPETCSHSGIIAPLVGIIGSIQAIEVLKVLMNIGQTLCGKLLLFDGYRSQWRTVKVPKDPHCPICASITAN
jgi:molybdopterin-synthase adenylyltransferase